MKKGTLLFALLVLVALSFVFSGEKTDVKAIIHPIESTIYSDMDALYALSGMARPSTNRPWSDAEARMILSRVDREGLSDLAAELYDRIEAELDKGLRWQFGDDFQLSTGIDFAMEMYAHSNSDDFTTEDDWERSYSERKSLMKFYFEFTSGDNFYTASDIHYRYKRADQNDTFGYYYDDLATADHYVASYPIAADSHAAYVKQSYQFTQNWFTNVYFDTTHFSFIWPRRAVLSFGGDTWNFSINRDVLSLGNANFGNMLVDDHHFSDYARLSFFGKYFKYDWVLLYLNTIVSDNEQHASTEGRIFMIHTLNFRVLERVSMTISENVMYRYENFDLQYLNPAFIYHNLNNRSMFNALAYLDLNVAVLPGLEVYAQYAMDQARAPHEGDSQSDASGLVAGIQYTNALGHGVLTSYAEYAQTTPLLYRRDIVDFVRCNRYWSFSNDTFCGGHVPFFDFIGFPYGGDCRMVELRSEYTSLDHFGVSVFARGMDRGVFTLYTSHSTSGNNADDANYKGKTPSGDIITRIFTCGVEFNADLDALFSWPGVSFDGEMDWINVWDYTKASKEYSNYRSDVQLTLGISVKI
jgi:hypothetical protein